MIANETTATTMSASVCVLLLREVLRLLGMVVKFGDMFSESTRYYFYYGTGIVDNAFCCPLS
jgi:hypothetical protein